MSNIPFWAALAASLSAVGALLNAITAVVNRYDAKMKAVKDLLAVRADFINSHINNGAINTNAPAVMEPVCNQVLQAENDIKRAMNVRIIKAIGVMSCSGVEEELRSHFFTLLHSSLQGYFRDGEEYSDKKPVREQIAEIKNIYNKF